MDIDALNEAFQVGVKKSIFNAAMREARLGLGLKQSDLGKMVGLSGVTVSAIEGFRAYPSDDSANKIAKALGKSRESLFPKWLEVYKLKTSTVVEKIEYMPLQIGEPSIMEIEAENSIESGVDNELLKDAIGKALEELSDREQKIIKMRFGLDGYKPHTLREVAAEFQVYSTRIQQIEAKILHKMRTSDSKRSRSLRAMHILGG